MSVEQELRECAQVWRDAAQIEADIEGEGTEDQEGMEDLAATLDRGADEVALLNASVAKSQNMLNEQAKTIQRQAAQLAKAVEVMRQAAEWFEQYAEGHTAKGDTDKAKRNQDRAAFCRAFLSEMEAGNAR